jgi:hypothetical protein
MASSSPCLFRTLRFGAGGFGFLPFVVRSALLNGGGYLSPSCRFGTTKDARVKADRWTCCCWKINSSMEKIVVSSARMLLYLVACSSSSGYIWFLSWISSGASGAARGAGLHYGVFSGKDRFLALTIILAAHTVLSSHSVNYCLRHF